VVALLVAAVTMLAVPQGMAQTISTWTGGGGSASWSDPNNWSSLPAVSDTSTTLLFRGTTRTATFNDRVLLSGTIQFTNNGLAGQTTGFTLSGSAMSLRGSSNGLVLTTTAIASGGTPITDTIDLDLDMQTTAGTVVYVAVNSGHDLEINGKVTGRSMSKRAIGTLTLTNTASTYAGFSPAEGSTRTPMLGLAGAASPLGTGTTIGMGSTTRTGTLVYTGVGETTDKLFLLNGNGGGAFVHDGSGRLVFSGTAFAQNGSTSASRLLRLAGTNTDDNEILAPIADNTATGVINIVKEGSGFWKFSAANTYTGSTAILGGRLTVAPTGGIANTSEITIAGAGADLRWNSATTMDRPLTFTQGTISGTGTIGVPVTVAANRVLSPGNSPGNQAYTAGLTLATSGSYLWEINNATGSKGAAWDLLTVSGGSLDLSTLGPDSTFNLNLVTLSGTAPGPMANYIDGNAYRWRIFDAGSLALPSTFNPFLVSGGTYASFTDVTSLFTLGTNSWQNASLVMGNVAVEVAADGTGLDLVIVGVVPEPAALPLAAAGLATAAAAWRRRCRRSVRSAP